MTAGPGEIRLALKRVLVADDSRVFRVLICEALRAHGLEVLEAADGREALDTLLSQRPELVVLDALMPMISGFDVMDRLRNAAPDYHPVVIVVTAMYKGRRWAAEARKLYQVAEYMEKPIEPEDLVRAIARHFPEFLGLDGRTP